MAKETPTNEHVVVNVHYSVLCPGCGAKIELPPWEPELRMKIAECERCATMFDFGCDDILEERLDQPPSEFTPSATTT